jgi:hypothetical protein
MTMLGSPASCSHLAGRQAGLAGWNRRKRTVAASFPMRYGEGVAALAAGGHAFACVRTPVRANAVVLQIGSVVPEQTDSHPLC